MLPQAARGPGARGSSPSGSRCGSPRTSLRDPPPAERAHRRRLQALEHRLSSLTLPPPLRRALAAALSQLREGRPETAAQVLSQLVAPAREAGGAEAGDALAQAARAARAAVRRSANDLGHAERP